MSAIGRLATMIDQLCPREGSHGTLIDGLYLTRSSTVDVPRQSLERAVFCVVAQGSKCTLLHEQRFAYDPNHYLLVSLDLPLVGQIERATPAEPFLGLSLVLDFQEIGSLLREVDRTPERADAFEPGIMVGQLNEDLLDAVIRLTDLLRKPEQIPVLAALYQREIYYKLLLSEQGGLLSRMVVDSRKVQRVAAGLAWLRRNVARPIRMEELAREMGMSPSAMHSWFRSVTSMSPLQYQKRLRLQEARRMLLAEAVDAGTASRRVGYESASQFSREYRRLFGAPPLRDIAVRTSVAPDLLPAWTPLLAALH